MDPHLFTLTTHHPIRIQVEIIYFGQKVVLNMVECQDSRMIVVYLRTTNYSNMLVQQIQTGKTIQTLL